MKLKYITIALFTIFSFQAVAQKYSNEFLNIGISARAQGMGNAFVASVDDVTSAYWNPAGLATFAPEQGLQLGAMHAEWFAGVGKFDYLGATIPLASPNRRVALSMIRFGVDGIPNTLSLYEEDGTVNYDNVTEFSAADYAFLTSYAQKLDVGFGDLYVGGNVKVVRRIIGTFANSWGFGLDLGAQLKRDKLSIGLVARDVTSTFNAWKVSFTEDEKEVLVATGNELPDLSSVEVTNPQLTLGVAYDFSIGQNVTLTPEVDFIITTDGRRNVLISGDPISIDPAVGMELNYNDFVFLRTGVKSRLCVH